MTVAVKMIQTRAAARLHAALFGEDCAGTVAVPLTADVTDEEGVGARYVWLASLLFTVACAAQVLLHRSGRPARCGRLQVRGSPPLRQVSHCSLMRHAAGGDGRQVPRIAVGPGQHATVRRQLGHAPPAMISAGRGIELVRRCPNLEIMLIPAFVAFTSTPPPRPSRRSGGRSCASEPWHHRAANCVHAQVRAPPERFGGRRVVSACQSG
jgi:hypothetical protein